MNKIAERARAVAGVATEWVKVSLRERVWPNDAHFLQAAYRGMFKRNPDADGIAYYTHALQSGQMGRRNVLGAMMKSDEFRQVRDLPIRPLDALHLARIQLIREALPPAETIVDLGGGSTAHPEGALLGLGYPHRPKTVWIVDLPPNERLLPSADTANTYVTSQGTQVRYLYRSMTDLSSFADASVDLVFSGESIEHVTEADGDLVCQEALRVLKPGGYFCLDTPNAELTRIQSPDAFIHPEHKKEYRIDELAAKLERWGFDVIETKGLCAMAESRRSRRFDYAEMTRNIGLTDNAEDGYLFFLKARKSEQG